MSAEDRPVGDVGREGRLAALRLRLALGDHRPVIVAPGAVAKLVAEPWAEGPLQRRGLDRGELGHGPDPELGQSLGRARPDAGDQSRRALADGLDHVLRLQDAEAVGLFEIGGDLREQLVGRQADRADQARLGADLALQLAGARLRRRAVGEVQIGLVQAGDLDPIAEPAQDVHHLARSAPIQPDVARDQRRLGAAPVGDRKRQSRVDAVPARLVGGRHHHAAGGGSVPVATTTGVPRSSGRRKSSTETKNASMSTWATILRLFLSSSALTERS